MQPVTGSIREKMRDDLTAEYGTQLLEGLGVMGCKRSGRGQACERAPAPDGVPEELPLQ
jgi:hypothetical protein